MSVSSRTALAALSCAGLVFCVTGSAKAAPPAAGDPVAAETPSAAPEAPPEATPEAPSPAEPPAAEPPVAVPEPESAAVPEAPPAAADEAPTEAAAEPTAPEEREGSDVEPTEVLTGPATEDDPDVKIDTIDPDLLAGEASEPSQPTSSTRTVVRDPAAYEAALQAAYDAEYRPADNPGRLHVAARALFANAGGKNEIGGRMGGMQVDVGQAWNRFGYALTASAWGGRILLADRVGEMNALVGAGPTLTFGRTALQQRGMIDLRLGYDFMYGVVNQRTDSGAVLAPQDDSSAFTLEQTENLLPHGPRAMLQLGLLSPKRRAYHHGFGVVFGYQGLVGSMRGELPFTHMLVTGLQWWMG